MPGYTSYITQNRLIYNSLCTHIFPHVSTCAKVNSSNKHYTTALLITRIVKILINNTTIRTHRTGQQTIDSFIVDALLFFLIIDTSSLVYIGSFVPEILLHTIAHSSIVFLFFFFLNTFFRLFQISIARIPFYTSSKVNQTPTASILLSKI